MVVDPVCNMSLDPAEATASVDYGGTRVYFCSEGCHRRFMADPESYGSALRSSPAPRTCDMHASHAAPDPRVLLGATATGVLATALLLSFYLGVLALVSGWTFTLQQFADYWPFIVTLAIGFGVQVGLFVYLRRAVHAAGSGKVVAATGTTSGVAMISCCSHYLVNLLPVLGATGLVTFVGQYQIELFWLGIAANLVGIAYIWRRVVSFTQGAYG